MSVEEASVRTLAHGVEPQKQIPEHLCREELQTLFMAIAAVGILNNIVEVRQNGVVGGAHPGEVRGVADAPLPVETLHHQLQYVNMGGVKVLVDAEDVTKERDVLCQQRAAKGRRGVRVIRFAAIVPVPGLQQVDLDLAAEQIQKAAVQIGAQLFHLLFRVQREDGFAGFQNIAQQELEKVALTLAAVAQDQHAGIGFVSRPAVQVHDDVGAEFLLAQVEAAGVRLA